MKDILNLFMLTNLNLNSHLEVAATILVKPLEVRRWAECRGVTSIINTVVRKDILRRHLGKYPKEVKKQTM